MTGEEHGRTVQPPDSNRAEVGPIIQALSVDELRARVVQLEGLLDARERRLSFDRRSFYANPIASVIYSEADLAILDANQSAVQLYGYGSERFRSLNVLNLFAEGTLRNFPELRDELQKPISSLGRVVHRGARGQDLIVSLLSLTVETDGASARILLIDDETERHNTEEALRSSEERFRELFENANDVIFSHDLKGTIQEVNRAAEYLTGYSRTEVLGKNFEELIAPEARHLASDIVRAHLGGSAPQHYELPIISKSGKLRFLEVSTRIMYRRGHPIAIQGIGRDITERKQAQQRLLESSRELQQKNEELSTALRLAREATQLKEQFLRNTSHELRTPMNGIMGMVDLLKTTELTSDQQEYADTVSQCANDLLTIINDLLDLSQIGAQRLSLDEEPFDLYDSLKNVINLLRVRAAAKDLKLSCEVDQSLPQSILGDSVRFRQVLTNLVANAVKFTPQGVIQIRLKPGKSSASFRCEVIDAGIGVADSVQKRIFEAFFQADGTTRRRFGGTGLGLTICKQLVELMGGEIGMHNNSPLPGATFWFELPLRAAGSRETETTSSSC